MNEISDIFKMMEAGFTIGDGYYSNILGLMRRKIISCILANFVQMHVVLNLGPSSNYMFLSEVDKIESLISELIFLSNIQIFDI